MSLRAVDGRFLLPEPPRSVALLPPRKDVELELPEAGIDLGHPGDAGVVTFVADPRYLRRVLGSGAHILVVEGRVSTAHRLGANGWTITRYFARSGPVAASFLGLDDALLRRYVAGRWSRPTAARARLRNLALGSPLGRLATNLLVATKSELLAPVVPYPIRAAADTLGLPGATRWFLQLGRGDDLQRIVAVVFTGDAALPSWVLKFSRLPLAPARARTEESVLAALRSRAPDCVSAASEVLGRLVIDGADATVERAAAGSTLTAFLRSSGSRSAHAMAGRVIRWAIRLGAESAERRPHWETSARTLLAEVGPVGSERLRPVISEAPSVVAHNDLASWNIVTDGSNFTVVDWESADITGFPLWDVVYLATDLLCELEGPEGYDERPQWCRSLWRGHLPCSGLLGHWLREAGSVVCLSPTQIGPLVAASWFHHSRSQERRSRFLSGHDVAVGYLQDFADLWCSEPGLGLDWSGSSVSGWSLS